MIKVYQDGSQVVGFDDGAISVEAGTTKGNVFVHDDNIEMMVHIKRGPTSLIKNGNHIALIQWETPSQQSTWLSEHPDWKEKVRLS